MNLGALAAFEHAVEAAAAHLTTIMSDEEIETAIRFWNGPVGKAWRTKSPEVLAREAAMGAVFGRLVAADAGRAFCRTNDCDGTTLKPQVGAEAPQPTATSPAASTRKP